jgi:hypothetical protein
MLALTVLFAGACSDSTGPEGLATLTVTPPTQTVQVTQTVQFTAAGTRAGLPVTNLQGEVWSVSGGGTISDTGVFTAGTTPGTSTITVTCGGRTSTATVTVTAGPLATIVVTPNPATLQIGATQQFTAVGRDAQGNVVAITPAWTVTNGGGTIGATTGLFTAGTALGTFANTVRATSGSIFGTATVVVTPGPLATITVTPNPVTLQTGATQQFTAVGRDAAGNVVAITPVWSVVAGGGTINAGTGLFTAGNTAGSFTSTVVATSGALSGNATVNVVAAPGALATITVTPNPASLQTGATQQFTAVGRDAANNVVPITPVWSVTNGGGTINSGSGLFTAGNTTGTFSNTVRATSGSIFGTATVTVTSTTPPPATPTSTFAILANAAVGCTDGSIAGDVGTFQASPTGSITRTSCPITNGTAQVGTSASIQAYNSFVTSYTNLATVACDVVLTGTQAGVTLAPGVYCFDAAASLTGTLTLNGPSNGVWLFKIGTSGVGALTGTNFNVVMAGAAQPCNVTWWVRNGATMTDANMRGKILSGAGVTLTRGTLIGNGWGQADATITGTTVTGC